MTNVFSTTVKIGDRCSVLSITGNNDVQGIVRDIVPNPRQDMPEFIVYEDLHSGAQDISYANWVVLNREIQQ